MEMPKTVMPISEHSQFLIEEAVALHFELSMIAHFLFTNSEKELFDAQESVLDAIKNCNAILNCLCRG